MREHDHGGHSQPVVRSDFLQHFRPADAGEIHVEQHEIEPGRIVPAEQFQGLDAVSGDRGLSADRVQTLEQEVDIGSIVVDDEDAEHPEAFLVDASPIGLRRGLR